MVTYRASFDKPLDCKDIIHQNARAPAFIGGA